MTYFFHGLGATSFLHPVKVILYVLDLLIEDVNHAARA